ncbi:MAG: TonB family protein [Victivallales bacterium]|nr:TonB family protein [Victivallales bacterium]
MSRNFLQLNLRSDQKLKKSRKRKTVFWVSVSHISAIFIIFAVFTFKGCTDRPSGNPISVTLVPPNRHYKQKDIHSEQPGTKHNLKRKKETSKRIKKRWKALDASQIKKTNNIITRSPAKKVQKTAEASVLANSLRNKVKTIKFENPYRNYKTLQNYNNKVSGYLYSRWQQPAKTVLDSRLPAVQVLINIDKYGNIRNYRILEESGIAAMDSSVKVLLQNLKKLPKPPKGAMEISVSLELEN